MENKQTFNLQSVIEDAKSMITNPVGFYRNLSKTGGLSDPIIFVLVMGVIAGLIFAVFSLLGLGRMAGAGFGAVIFLPIMLLIGSFIFAAILYVIWKLMGSENNYETAYRCVAYSLALLPIMAVLSAIPYIGTLIHTLWGSYLMYIASIEVHRLAPKISMIVFGVLALIGLMSNLGAEKSSRMMDVHMGKFGEHMEGMEDMTPEEIGRAAGEFMRGLEDGAKAE